MSKIIILVTMLMPLILFGQSKLSIGGMGAFYRPGLAEVNERFEVANSAGFDGVDVDQLEGNFLFGGFLGYQMLTNLGLRLQMTHWSEEASIIPPPPVAGVSPDPRIRPLSTENQEIQVRTLMLDWLFYVNQPGSSIRVYFGAGFGVVFIRDKTSSETVFGFKQSGEESFREFGFKPIVGADLFSAGKINLFVEAGYLISNYPVITSTLIEAADGSFSILVKAVKTSLNGLNATVGVKLSL